MTSQTIPITYRPMADDDLANAHTLSQGVRWPHRLEDWQFGLRLGAGFVAEEDGAVVGTALCWKQGEHAGSLGMIIVSSAHQGKGIGRKLMQLVLEELGGRSTLLNATPSGQPLYESLGFKAIGTVHQHQGTMAAMAPQAGAGVRPAEAHDLAGIIALANRATGMTRNELLKQLLSVGEGAVLERDGELAGFSIMRHFGRGHVIGPVVAPDCASAQALIAHWSGAYAGAFVRVDVTGASAVSGWLADAGLPQVDTGVTMARHGMPAEDRFFRQFAIANQALC